MISTLYYARPDGRVTPLMEEKTAPEARLQAPNASPCGTWVLYNAEGRLWRYDLAAGTCTALPSDVSLKCNNDHGFGPDGTIIFGSHHAGKGAEFYQMAAEGGRVEKLSSAAPSWWHGLSPDGTEMVYAAVRGETRVLDIYTRALAGGPERRLTQGLGHNDGPEFSADGTRIYWNSDRAGEAQIWVMERDGSAQRPLIADGRVNWFPHPSPDGKWLIWLSYPPGTEGHPFDLPVRIMISDPEGQGAREIMRFCGGQGTMNVPCWRKDSAGFYFFGYRPEAAAGV